MASLIVTMRLEVLKANLQDVQDVMDLANRRGQDIQALRNDLFGPDSVRGLVTKLDKSIGRAQVEVRDPDLQQREPSFAAVFTELENASVALQDLKARLERCQRALDMLVGGRVELGTRQIQQRLLGQAGTSIRDVETLIEDSRTNPIAWDMVDQLSEQSGPLFAEYVDLLRGLALRESGIGRGICELADRLLDGCDRIAYAPWKSVAIPSHQGPSMLTPARIIRLGFPEWTIWALPLAAYEFGRIIVAEDKALTGGIVDGKGAIAPGFGPMPVDCLADAIAMYAVGPAYACSAIFMRLNPRPATPGGPAADGPRAEMIFEMLKVVERTALGVSFADVTRKLKDAWDEAVTEAGAAATAGDFAAGLAEHFMKWAKINYVTARYQATSWIIAQNLRDLAQQRLSGDPLTPENEATMEAGVNDVRDMLNAAWLSRLEKPDKAEGIAKQAQALWEETRLKASKATGMLSRGTAALGVQPGRRTE